MSAFHCMFMYLVTLKFNLNSLISGLFWSRTRKHFLQKVVLVVTDSENYVFWRLGMICRLTTYRHRFARAALADLRRIVDVPVKVYCLLFACRLITYRQRFARVAPAPRAKRFDAKNRGRASPVKLFAFY